MVHQRGASFIGNELLRNHPPAETKGDKPEYRLGEMLVGYAFHLLVFGLWRRGES